MAEFDIKKVITIKDYLIDPSCVEVGKRYYMADTIYDLETRVKKGFAFSSGEYKGIFKTEQNEIESFRVDGIRWQYLYPYEEQLKKYRPFKRTELIALIGRKVREKMCNNIAIVTAVDEEDDVCILNNWFDSEELLARFEILNYDDTTSPCGISVEDFVNDGQYIDLTVEYGETDDDEDL